MLTRYDVNPAAAQDATRAYNNYIRTVSSEARARRIEELRAAYATIETIDPCGPAYEQLTEMLDIICPEFLQELANANIKFVSKLAQNRLIRAGR